MSCSIFLILKVQYLDLGNAMPRSRRQKQQKNIDIVDIFAEWRHRVYKVLQRPSQCLVRLT